MRILLSVAISATLVLLAGCDSSRSSDESSHVGVSTPAGIWRAVEVVPGQSVMEAIVFISADRKLFAIREDGLHLRGPVQLGARRAIVGTYEAAYELGSAFGDDATHGAGSFQGTYEPQDSFEIQFSTNTAAGSTIAGTMTGQFQALSLQPSSLDLVAGIYGTNTESLTVSGTGAVFLQDAVSGCVANGQISTIDRDYNLYEVYVWVENCVGEDAAFNGVHFNGYAALEEGALIGGAIGESEDGKIAILLDYPRI